jgi:hypothetical protein
MSQHQRLKIRASRLAEQAQRTIPTFFYAANSKGKPDQFLSLGECQRLKAEGRGQFINHRKAFRLAVVANTPDNNSYKSSSRRGESLRIDEPAHGSELGMMSRYVEGDKYAVAAVEAWA